METLPITSVKRFYFLQYFYILLECADRYDDKERMFTLFQTLKQRNRLGESKYRKNISEGEYLTDKQINTYRYTFEQVIAESKEHGLVVEQYGEDRFIPAFRLTKDGRELLKLYRSRGEAEANKKLFEHLEHTYGAFRQFIDFLYVTNPSKKGLLILPSYSPRQLNIEKSAFKTGNDFLRYLDSLIARFNEDFHKFLGPVEDASPYSIATLRDQSKRLVKRLTEENLLPRNPKDRFRIEKYNSVTKRTRDYWMTYFLRDIYRFSGSITSFDIWAYRAKQIGILHVTEFFPNISGRLAYPTAVVVNKNRSPDFEELFEYADGEKLFIHSPNPTVEQNQSAFIERVYKAYLDLRRTTRSYYINIPPLREKVCYSMKISERVFEAFLAEAYKLNLQGNLPFFSISLEVDRNPEETTAMYIKQEPIMIDGQYKNIIGIDMTKGDVK